MSASFENATIRQGRRRENPFVMIDHSILEDPRISWAAKGLLAYLLSKPPGWTARMHDIREKCPEGRDKVYKLINQLIEAGYVERRPLQSDKGRYIGIEYRYHEIPIPIEQRKVKKKDRTAPLPLPENPDMASSPLPENPDMEKPDAAIRENSNNNDPSKKEINNKDIKNNNRGTDSRGESSKPSASESKERKAEKVAASLRETDKPTANKGGEADAPNAPSEAQSTANYKEVSKMVSDLLEAKVGEGQIKELMEKYGRTTSELMRAAVECGRKSDKINNLVGYYLRATREGWTGVFQSNLGGGAGAAPAARDERYSAFYELFPDA